MLEQSRLIVGTPDRQAAVARLHTGHAGFADHAADVSTPESESATFLRARQADTLHNGVDALGKSRRYEARIAPRGTTRDLARVENGDRPAAPRDFTRYVNPASPAPMTQTSASRSWLSAGRSGAATAVAAYQVLGSVIVP